MKQIGNLLGMPVFVDFKLEKEKIEIRYGPQVYEEHKKNPVVSMLVSMLEQNVQYEVRAKSVFKRAFGKCTGEFGFAVARKADKDMALWNARIDEIAMLYSEIFGVSVEQAKKELEE